MISIVKQLTAGTHTLYQATEQGTITMLSVVNTDTGDCTLNIYKKDVNGVQVKIIAKDTKIEDIDAAYIAGRVIKSGQSIIIVTTKAIDVDLNIV